MNIAILITNPNHHVELTLPVATGLIEQGISVKYISLCELRRMKTPSDLLEEHKIPYTQMDALAGDMKPSTGSQSLGDNNSLKRRVLRRAFWLLKLRKFISQAIRNVDKVVLMNDAAFPGDMICELLKSRKIPFYLMQEGIRFPLPNETVSKYGAMGAEKILAWGDHSARHFEKVKLSKTKVIAVGSPRIDNQYQDFQNSAKRSNEKKVLGFFTNPIDDMGYTTPGVKLGMSREFFNRFGEFLNQNGISVLIKCHPREDPNVYLKVVSQYVDECTISTSDINEAIKSVDVGIIMASTVGLELLMANKKVIQLNIPEYGYVFDYVSSGPVLPDNKLDNTTLLSCFELDTENINPYLSVHFANLGASSIKIVRELLIS